jgi:pantoate kinase
MGPLPISEEVARRLAARRPGVLEVTLRHDLPVGQGFGTSASGALATALAVGAVVRVPRATSIATAHLADLFGGGGLGGVASILGGGLEFRRRPGIPPIGRVEHRTFGPPLLLALVGGPMPSPALLRSEPFLDRVHDASAASMRAMDRAPTVATFLREAERFTDRLEIAPGPVQRTIAALRAAGARSSQAMFGRSVVAVALNAAARRRALKVLEGRRLAAVEVRAATTGAYGTGRPNRTLSGGALGPPR